VQACCILLWTSAYKGPLGVEFSSLLNEALRNDGADAMGAVAKITRGINELIVSRPIGGLRVAGDNPWPYSNVLHRGSAIPKDAYAFYFGKCTSGEKFRVPMYLATSTEALVADKFLLSSAIARPDAIPVKWIIHLDPEEKCHHTAFIKGAVDNEFEFLFVPYSVFSVLRCDVLNADSPPNHRHPIVIELFAWPDNSRENETLQLSSWI